MENQEVIINADNIKEIEAKLEDLKFYWAKWNIEHDLSPMFFDQGMLWNGLNTGYVLTEIYSIIPAPITPPKPLPIGNLKDELIKMAQEKYPLGTKFLHIPSYGQSIIEISNGKFNADLNTGDIWMIINDDDPNEGFYVYTDKQWASYPLPKAGDNVGC